MKVRLIRANGVEVEPIFEDDNYDFNYQQVRMKHNPVKVYPVRNVINLRQLHGKCKFF